MTRRSKQGTFDSERPLPQTNCGPMIATEMPPVERTPGELDLIENTVVEVTSSCTRDADGAGQQVDEASPVMRRFSGGATRDLDDDKLDFEGFFSPLVLQRYAEYMHKHRNTAAGRRDSDNWQAGMGLNVWIKSGWRHFFDWWSEHRGWGSREGIEEAICGLMFNAMGYLHELLKAKKAQRPC